MDGVEQFGEKRLPPERRLDALDDEHVAHGFESRVEDLRRAPDDAALAVDDVDARLREQIEAAIGAELFDEDAQEVVDAVVLWWRDGDGDLVDELVDVQTTLDDGGVVWLLTPKAGRDDHVSPADIQEAASTSGSTSAHRRAPVALTR